MRHLNTALMVAGLALVCSWQVSGQTSTDFGEPGSALEGQPADPVVDPVAEPAPDVETDPVKEDYIPGGQEGSSRETAIAISGDAVSAVWALIDVNKNGRATDKEVYEARRSIRRLANHPDPTAIRDEIRQEYDTDGDGVISTAEGFVCLSQVRGERCPTAANAREYWLSLDSDHSGAVEPSEFHELLRPLGRVGEAMESLLDNTLAAIDEDDNHRVVELEVYRRANAMLLIQLATEGENIAAREPIAWITYVFAVANLDMDASNNVSAQESLALSEFAECFETIDTNDDYSVTVSEMCDFRDELNAILAATSGGGGGGFSSGSC